MDVQLTGSLRRFALVTVRAATAIWFDQLAHIVVTLTRNQQRLGVTFRIIWRDLINIKWRTRLAVRKGSPVIPGSSRNSERQIALKEVRQIILKVLQTRWFAGGT